MSDLDYELCGVVDTKLSFRIFNRVNLVQMYEYNHPFFSLKKINETTFKRINFLESVGVRFPLAPTGVPCALA